MSDYSTYYKQHYVQDLVYCKQFLFSFGSNYKLATQLFPRNIKEATMIFYAFVRYPDELVDNPEYKLPGQTHKNIDEYITEWEEVVAHGPSNATHPLLRANYYLFNKYEIPFDYSFDFLRAMKQDLTQTRYDTYTELEHYMWGSASVVGHVMTFIVGYKSEEAFVHAKNLGEAMQLANFLRDIDEDYQQRNRIYLPQNDRVIFAVIEQMISLQKMTPELYNFIKHYTERCEILFKKGIAGIKYLKNGKFSIFLASRMYRENIRILARRNYNIFQSQIRLSKSKKILIFLTTLCIYPFWLMRSS